MNVIGVMSGSSLDGVDVVLVDLSGEPIQWKLLHSHTLTFTESLRSQLSTTHQQAAKDLLETEYEFTNFLAKGLADFINSNKIDCKLIGVHGHTIWHQPQRARSWQLVNGGMLAEHCACNVVCDFRNQDMALGGQGAPMAILADRDLFPGHDYYLNLGGIANIAAYKPQQLAYDLCPCNQLLNHYANEAGHPFDDKGQLAASGKVSSALLAYLIEDSYISKPPPKSMDNGYSRTLIEEINKRFELSIEDKLRTIVEYISQVIINTQLAPNTRVFVTGGGAYNTYLTKTAAQKLNAKGISLVLPEKELIDNKEAILIAYAAYLRYKGLPNFISSATGASQDAIGGALYTYADA